MTHVQPRAWLVIYQLSMPGKNFTLEPNTEQGAFWGETPRYTEWMRSFAFEWESSFVPVRRTQSALGAAVLVLTWPELRFDWTIHGVGIP